jgi:hypothetical protein
MISNSAKEKWINFFSDKYTPFEWLCTKLCLIMLIGPGLLFPLFTRIDAPYPASLCVLINCNQVLQNPFKWIIAIVIVSALLLYLFEVRMVYTTLLLFFLSLLIYSIEESNGLLTRRGVLSLLFFAQFLAYLFNNIRPRNSLAKDRIQFTAQFIAAAYLLAAISKLTTSGMAWISDSPNVALQVLKSFDYSYFDTGLKEELYRGAHMSSLIAAHLVWVKFLFGSALILEFFSFMLLGSKRTAFIYALFLLAMHIGILITMDIFFPTITFPLITFLINPIYLLYLSGYSAYCFVKYHLKSNQLTSGAE